MGRRRLLHTLPPAERQQLAELIASYVNDTIVEIHRAGHSWHHAGSEQFFIGHRGYLDGLESYLRQSGNARFVPLPAWDPDSSIPAEFTAVKPTDRGATRPALADLSPGLPKPANLATGAVCAIATVRELSLLTQPWHGAVHGQIGGTMADVNVSPAALIFWCWHAFIDDIYDDWLSCTIEAVGRPWGYPGGATARVVFRGHDAHLHEIALTQQWMHFDMTGVPGAVPPAGNPMGYASNVPRVVYRGDDGRLHELAIYPETGAWGDFDMTGVPGAVPPAGDPMGYVFEVPRVVYRGDDGRLHELAIYPETGAWGDFDMTGVPGAVPPAGNPMGYASNVPRVVYRGDDGHLHELAIYPETGAWGDFDMTGVPGAVPPAGDPMGYVFEVPRVVYRGDDGRLHELAIYPETGTWGDFDMTRVPGAVPPAGNPMGYASNVPRVVYRGDDGHLHELAIYPETGTWGDFDMTGVPGAVPPAGDPMGYVDANGTARVVYQGTDNHLHELWLADKWYHFDMTVTTRRD